MDLVKEEMKIVSVHIKRRGDGWDGGRCSTVDGGREEEEETRVNLEFNYKILSYVLFICILY